MLLIRPDVAATVEAIAGMFAGNPKDADFAMPCCIAITDSAIAKAFEAANNAL